MDYYIADKITFIMNKVPLVKLKATKKSIQIDGVNSNYYEAGNPFGEPLVFVHGFTDKKESFLNTASCFDLKKYHIFIPDLPGHGEADKNNELAHDLEFFVNWFHQFIDLLDLNNCHLVANSMGGAISASYMINHEHQAKTLTLINPAGIYVRDCVSVYDRYYEGRNVFNIKSTDDVMHMLDQVLYKVPIIPRFYQNYLFKIAEENNDWFEKMIVDLNGHPDSHDKEDMITKLSLNPFLKDITIPTLIIWGKEDGFFPQSYGKEFHNLIPNSKIQWIEKCGHGAHYEKPKLVSKLVQNFHSTNRGH